MRNIRFRAWDKKNKKMESQGFSISPNGRILFNEFFWNDSNPDVDIMQFTGLKDKNGKEIYEGDILKWNFCEYHDWDRETVGVVEWKHSGLTCLGDLIEPMTCDTYEVIGNIYQDGKLEEINDNTT